MPTDATRNTCAAPEDNTEQDEEPAPPTLAEKCALQKAARAAKAEQEVPGPVQELFDDMFVVNPASSSAAAGSSSGGERAKAAAALGALRPPDTLQQMLNWDLKHKPLCLPGSECYTANAHRSEGGKRRRSRKHMAGCLHGKVLEVQQKRRRTDAS